VELHYALITPGSDKGIYSLSLFTPCEFRLSADSQQVAGMLKLLKQQHNIFMSNITVCAKINEVKTEKTIIDDEPISRHLIGVGELLEFVKRPSD
jgi:hypothetical protein